MIATSVVISVSSLTIMKNKKNSVLLFFGLSIIAVVLLMISLPEFQLSGSQPLPLNIDVKIPVMGTVAVIPGGNVLYWIIRGIAALIIVGLPIYVIYNLFSPQGRRRLLADVFILVILVFILDRISRSVQNQPKEETTQSAESPIEQPPPGGSTGGSSEQFEAKTPEWLVWGASIGVALFLTSLIGLGLWFYYRRQFRSSGPLEQLAQEAEKAVTALQGGGDFKNIIIRCYYQMSQILYSERGIRRDLAMTPSEFEQALEAKGLPSEPIQYLTKIFEDVRYGTKQPAKREEDKAIWYLTVIAEASKNKSPG